MSNFDEESLEQLLEQQLKEQHDALKQILEAIFVLDNGSEEHFSEETLSTRAMLEV